jgi:phosphoribosylanthranilate isomerase
MTRVKICGITRVEDGLACARLGVDAIGLVFYQKSPRAVNPRSAREITLALPPFISSVALFVNPTLVEVEAVLTEVRPDVLQFHGDEPPEFCRRFGVPYLKAIRVKPGVDLVQYADLYSDAKGLLLDAYVEGTPGGTGQSFDWSLIPAGLTLPLVLSGGLDAGNVAQAIRRVKPWAVDVSSGVEVSKGIKDAGKIAAFMQGVRDGNV